MKTPKLIWDEPPDCTTPRGWARFTKDSHPDRKARSYDYHVDCGALNIGNYLDYGPTTARGPKGETVHAVAFVHRINETTQVMSEVRLGYLWCNTIEEAKAYIEGNVMAYFGLHRDGSRAVA
jgi:hypothetical protein